MMGDQYILALDQGTTNSKALLLDGDGAVVSRASRPLATCSPRPGFVEQDADEIWASMEAAAKECLGGRRSEDVRAIAISNQRETVVLWDAASGRPVCPAVSWQCRRSNDFCESLRAQGLEPTVRAKTGLGIDPLFSASKIAWLLDNDSDLRARAERGELRCGTVESWLIWKLTEGRVHATDLSNASRTQLLNLRTLDWDDDLLAIFRIPRSLLPSLAPSSGLFGQAATRSFFGCDVPIMSALGDSHAALAAHAFGRANAVKATYGTGSSLMMLASAPSGESHDLSSTIAWATRSGGAQYALEGNITMTGGAVEWCGSFLGLADPVADLVRLADSVPSSESVFFVPAMCGLGSPYWSGSARGCIVGLERGSTMAHLARAAIDSVAYQVRDVYESMQRAAGIRLKELYADGGATRNRSLMQLQADVLGSAVLRSSTAELSAVGAALLAGVALGIWSGPGDMAALKSPPERFEPRMDAAVREERYAGWKSAVEAALGHSRRSAGGSGRA